MHTMTRPLLLAVALLAAQVRSQPDTATATHPDDGVDAVPDPATYAFLAAIQPVASAASNVSLRLCSGVLIRGQGLNADTGAYVDKYYILTAASCVLPGVSCDVYLGTNEVRADAVPDLVGVTTADMVIHPEFLTTGMQHSDVAVIAADSITTVFASGKKLSTARLPSIEEGEDSYVASRASFTAWSSAKDSPTPVLRQVNTHVWPNWLCSVLHLDKHVTKQHVCAGGLFSGAGPCTGDAGAPLTRNGEVIGLATMVPSKGCGGGRPGLFTRLASHLAWIMQTTNYDPYQ